MWHFIKYAACSSKLRRASTCNFTVFVFRIGRFKSSENICLLFVNGFCIKAVWITQDVFPTLIICLILLFQ